MVGNVVRGGNTSSDVGLVYEAVDTSGCPPADHHSGANSDKGPCGLLLASVGNLVTGVGIKRTVGTGVELVDPL